MPYLHVLGSVILTHNPFMGKVGGGGGSINPLAMQMLLPAVGIAWSNVFGLILFRLYGYFSFE